MQEFIKSFRNYYKKVFISKKTGKSTGTANSYAKAFEYLCIFFRITKIDFSAINELQKIEADIRNSESTLYLEFYDFLMQRNAVSYLIRGFVNAAFPRVYYFWENKISSSAEDYQILKSLNDDQIKISFNKDIVSGKLPEPAEFEHDYSSKENYGRAQTGVKKIYSGRKAEKYVIDFLSYLGFEKGLDFRDVSNQKNFGYDVELLNCGYEVKNIKSGSFYLTDNEIALLLLHQTALLLVDINNGIWLLTSNSKWLEQTIKNIVEIREYAKKQFPDLDLSDIKISIKGMENEAIEISQYSKDQLVEIL